MSLTRVKDVTDKIKEGGTPSTANELYWKGGDIPWISAKDIDFPSVSMSKTITQKGLENSSVYLWPKKSILFTSKGSNIGKIGVTSFPLVTNQNVMGLSANKLVLADYLSLVLENDKGKIKDQAKTTTFGAINIEDMAFHVFNLPPIPEQVRLAQRTYSKILSADAGISCLKQKLIHLDEYKTALIHNAVTNGLDANGCRILDGTPAWRKSKLKSVASYQKGSKPKNLLEVSAKDTLPYISMQQLRGNVEAKEYAKIGDGILVNDNDLIILWDGANAGELIRGKLGILSSTMAVFRSQNIDLDYLYYSLVANEHELRNKYIGMGIPHVSSEILNSILISYPDDIKDQLAISDFINRNSIRIDEAKKAINKKIDLLIEYKKSLINDAVSGVRIEEDERVGAA